MNKNQKRHAVLALENGIVLHGETVCPKGWRCGEVVFNTAMSGFQEICSDPSYFDKIVVLTCPHIGNVGFNEDDYESCSIWLSGLVVCKMSLYTSNYRSTGSFVSFLGEHNAFWMDGVDTRYLTRIIREEGTQNGCLLISNEYTNGNIAIQLAKEYVKSKDGVKKATTKKSFYIPNKKKSKDLICVYDFGVKRSILHHLSRLNCQIKVIPASSSWQEALSTSPNAIVLSNGPGNPADLIGVIENIKHLIYKKTPIIGVCLGCQLIALAVGCKTKKMKYGHHGVNHPIINLQTKQVFISSQNHDFVIDEESLTEEILITHRSLFDGTIQGIELRGKPIFGMQGHPEGSPGPRDMQFLLNRFINMIKKK